MSNPAFTECLDNPKLHTCSCSHVEWAHWPNSICAHCNCPGYDGKPNPSRVENDDE